MRTNRTLALLACAALVAAPALRAPTKAARGEAVRRAHRRGAEFDRALLERMVKHHEKTPKLLQDTPKNAKDGEIYVQMAKQVLDGAVGKASRVPISLNSNRLSPRRNAPCISLSITQGG